MVIEKEVFKESRIVIGGKKVESVPFAKNICTSSQWMYFSKKTASYQLFYVHVSVLGSLNCCAVLKSLFS